MRKQWKLPHLVVSHTIGIVLLSELKPKPAGALRLKNASVRSFVGCDDACDHCDDDSAAIAPTMYLSPQETLVNSWWQEECSFFVEQEQVLRALRQLGFGSLGLGTRRYVLLDGLGGVTTGCFMARQGICGCMNRGKRVLCGVICGQRTGIRRRKDFC
jgi:hypothetical protein